MNAIELLQRFRDDVPEPSTDAWLRAGAALAAAKQGPIDQSASVSGRTPRSRRARPGGRRSVSLGLAGVAAALALALGLTGVFGPGPSANDGATQHRKLGTIRTAAFILTGHANGTDTLTLNMSEMLDPAALQRALAQHGIPALVKTDISCTSSPALPDPNSIGVLSSQFPFPFARGLVPAPNGAGNGGHTLPQFETVINPAAIPFGTELFFDYSPGDNLVRANLISINSHTCRS